MTASTLHAVRRTFERVGVAIGMTRAERLATLADRCAAETPAGLSVAVRLSVTPFIGTPWADTSNGDTLVAIIRDGVVVTLMFRRSTQPFTAAALRVDRCAVANVPEADR